MITFEVEAIIFFKREWAVTKKKKKRILGNTNILFLG